MLLSASRKCYYWVQLTSPWAGQTGTVVDSLLHDPLRNSDLLLVTNFLGKKPTPREDSPHPNSSAQTLLSDRSQWKKTPLGRGEPHCLPVSDAAHWFFWSYFTYINRPRQRVWGAETALRCLLSTRQSALHHFVHPVTQIQPSLNARGGTAPDPKRGILGARAARGSQQAHKPSRFEESLSQKLVGIRHGWGLHHWGKCL